MCGPLAIAGIGLAISAAQSVATVMGQQAQAQAQADAQNDYNRQLERNALTARNQNLANLEAERNTALGDTREQINQNQMALRRAQATARVSAGEAGISGLSVDALLRDLEGQAGYDNSTATTNYLRQDQQINVRRENIQNQYESTLNGVRQPTTQSPNYLGAALSIGQSGLNAYGSYKQLSAAQTK